MIKKADILLLILLVILGLFSSFIVFIGNTEGDTVRITVDGKLYGEYSLKSDREITVESGDHVNNITIKDGSVQMTYSSCRNQICVNHGSMHLTNDRIVCLPNRVIIEITGKGGSLDDISG